MENLGTLVIAGFLAIALGCSNGGGGSTPSGGSSTGGARASGGSGAGGMTAAGGSGAGGMPATGGSGAGGMTAAGGSGAGGATATGGSAGSNGTDSCPLPNCLKSLAPDCAESGDCTTQTDLSTDNWNTCYTNGITERVISNTSTSGRTVTVKKGSSTCFSTAFNQNDVIAGTGAITVTNASGTKVASVTIDATSNLYTVTCTGGQAVVLDQSCFNVYPVSALMGSGCDEGACVP